ncbi:hypothetical protein AB205_0035270, partial [Aquarana catesbeiana]
ESQFLPFSTGLRVPGGWAPSPSSVLGESQDCSSTCFFPDAAAILGRAVRGLHPPDVRYPEVGRHPRSRRHFRRKRRGRSEE